MLEGKPANRNYTWPWKQPYKACPARALEWQTGIGLYSEQRMECITISGKLPTEVQDGGDAGHGGARLVHESLLRLSGWPPDELVG